MTKQRVFEQAVGAAIAYSAGLGVLWLWGTSTNVPVSTALLIGAAVAVPVAVAVDYFAFRRSLREQFGSRPLRYSLPAVPAFLAAAIAIGTLSASDRPDRGSIAFAVCFGLIVVGTLASNWWWAHSTTAAGDINER